MRKEDIMNKKKLIAGLLAAVLVLSLTACAGGNNKTEETINN